MHQYFYMFFICMCFLYVCVYILTASGSLSQKKIFNILSPSGYGMETTFICSTYSIMPSVYENQSWCLLAIYGERGFITQIFTISFFVWYKWRTLRHHLVILAQLVKLKSQLIWRGLNNAMTSTRFPHYYEEITSVFPSQRASNAVLLFLYVSLNRLMDKQPYCH